MFVIDARGKSALLLSDIHAPYSHPDFLLFLAAIKKKLKPDITLSVGDEADFHGINFHDHEAELFSADHELMAAKKELQELAKLFPKIHFCESNHGSMLLRRLKKAGVPIRVLRELSEIYETPKWSWHENLLVKTKQGDVLVTHGKSAGSGTLAKNNGCSVIQGHYHGKFEITWHKGDVKEFFSMFVGCLVDYNSLAMRYGRNFVQKPILGVGWLGKDGTPKLIKMNLDKKGRWTKKLSLI
jgi:hypothetical protein